MANPNLYFHSTKTTGYSSAMRDMDYAIVADGTLIQCSTSVTTSSPSEVALNAHLSGGSEPAEFITQPIGTSVTVSGTITVHSAHIMESVATVNAAIRAKFWRLTAGGSNIEDYLGSIDASAELATNMTSGYEFTGTLSSFILSPGERIIVRLFVIPVGTFGTGTVVWEYNQSQTLSTWVRFTETIDMMLPGSLLYLRDTTANGLSGFRDLLPSLGGTGGTGVVTTTSGGSDIQWTKTAGGAVLQWASRRLARAATFTTPAGYPLCRLSGLEGSNPTNTQFRVRVWKRNLAGTETLLWGPYNTEVELTTTQAAYTISEGTPVGTPGLTATLDIDDRIVVRVYAHNKGTMGSSTATMITDAGSGAVSQAYMAIGAEGLIFKGESEPDTPLGGTSSGLMTTGIGD